VNVFKPDPGVFGHALRRVNLFPPDAMYVGDNYYADVVGSRAAGLRPILYDPLGIFPDPDCETIKSFDDLKSILKVI
jgi:putative hydrolase of the HAD superfamily